MKKKNIDAPPQAKQTGLDHFLSTIALVCRIPLPFSFTFSAQRLDFWLPMTALFQSLIFVIGLGVFAFMFRDMNLALAAALILLYGCFNLFHFDGLLDTADAFLGAFDRDKRFAILKDPRIGVYGVFAAFIYLALKLMILQSLFGVFAGSLASSGFVRSPIEILWYILIFPLSGKTAAAIIPALFPPAKQEGLGALAAGSRKGFVLAGFLLSLAIYAILCFGIAALLSRVSALEARAAALETVKDLHIGAVGMAGILLVISAFMPSIFLGRLYKKGLGGYTGDTLGAAVELGELIYLGALFVLIRWSQ